MREVRENSHLPAWPPRDWRALIALIASIAGAAVLTGFSIWLVRLLVMFARADPKVRLEVIRALANSNYGLLIVIGSILLSLGLAINRRSLRASAFGASIEADGGDGQAEAGDDRP
jgi:NO-binding membrane sensor protein with MHYT domain